MASVLEKYGIKTGTTKTTSSTSGGSSPSGSVLEKYGIKTSKVGTKKPKTNSVLAKYGIGMAGDDLDTIEKSNLTKAERLTSQGYGEYVPDLKTKAMNTLEKVADILSRGQYAGVGATAALMGNVDESAVDAFWKGLKGEKKYSTSQDLLKGMNDSWKKSVAGFAGDVLLDPTTYLTIGTGAAAKVGGVNLTKAGVKALGKEGAKLVGREATEAALKKAAKKAGVDVSEYIAKSGLRAEIPFVGGQTLITGETVAPIAKAAKSLIRKIPGEKFVEDTLGRTFKVGYGLPEAYNAIKNRYKDQIRYGKSQAVERAIELGKGLNKKQRQLVTMGIEQGSDFAYKGADAQVVNTAIKSFRQAFKDLADREVKEGILDAGQVIDNYVPHYYKEYRDELLNVWKSLDRPPRVNPGFVKGRKIKTLKDAEKLNLTPEMDVAGLYGQRAAASEIAIGTKRMLDEIKNQFAVKVKKHAVESGGTRRMVYDRLPGYEVIENIKELKGYQVPREIAEDLAKFYKAITSDVATNRLMRGYDKLLNYWKGMVTGINPAYHTTNMIGNLFNNWLGGVNNPIPYVMSTKAQMEAMKGGTKAVKGVLKTPNGEVSMREVVEAAERYIAKGFYGGDIIEEVPKAIEHGVKGLGEKAIDTLKFWKAPQNIVSGGRKVGGAIEGNARLAHFIDKVSKGYSYEEAAQSVKKYLFDYEELTDFEKTVMKRIVPFYTWMRNNIPLQIEQMIQNPRKAATLPKFQRNYEGEEGAKAREKERRFLPEYLSEQFNIRTGEDAKGNPIYSRVMLPWAEFARITDPKDWVGAMSPILKIPAELFFNKESYFGRPIYDPELPPELRTVKVSQDFAALPKELKKFLNVREVERETEDGESYTEVQADALKLYLIKNVMLPRIFGEVTKLRNEDIPNTQRWQSFISPVKPTPIDIDREKFYQNLEASDTMSKAINKLLKEKAIPELPKGRKKKKDKTAQEKAAEKLLRQRLGYE